MLESQSSQDVYSQSLLRMNTRGMELTPNGTNSDYWSQSSSQVSMYLMVEKVLLFENFKLP